MAHRLPVAGTIERRRGQIGMIAVLLVENREFQRHRQRQQQHHENPQRGSFQTRFGHALLLGKSRLH